MEDDDDCAGNTSADEIYLHHDWTSDESVSTLLIEGIAAVTDTPPTDLDPPLYEIVNPEAVDTLWEPLRENRLRHGRGHLTLPIYDCTVTLYSDGTIKIELSEES